MTAVLGLDIGGANLKAAHSAGVALSRPFALWKYPDRLAAELRTIREAMPRHEVLAVTMTGELCDCFGSKRDGVLAILRSVEHAANGVPVRVWTTHGEFVGPVRVHADPLPAAAANWLALAYLAMRFTDGQPAVLIDTGSTTTDVIFLDGQGPQPRGRTDQARLASGELVYTGIRRTPVCAVLGIGVAAEFFATMGDAYLLLGLLPEDPEDSETADGRPATRRDAHARMARMVCADAGDLTRAEGEALAHRAVTTQVGAVSSAIEKVLAGRTAPRRLILAGSGEVLGRQLRLTHALLGGLPCVSLTEQLGAALSEAACAYAVALHATGTEVGSLSYIP